ncbi:hypothetical protein [Microbacterium sp. ABRD28]|uniref:hypothetical protein n=1 Tax=Microbacterium sp. ABRD28 TaxID=2268461 RepID=UPI0013DDD26D|nr:hypothetical protein [Microbacterium sp. ABRD28]
MDDAGILALWADRLGYLPMTDDGTFLVGWGDLETAFAIREDSEGFTVDKQSRGQWATLGRFSARSEAEAFLAVCLASIWRADRGLGDVFPADPAPDTTVTRTDEGYDVGAGGHHASFRQRSDAKRYTYVAGRGLQKVNDFLMQ